MSMVLPAHYHIPITVSSAHYLLFTDDDACTEHSRRLFLEAGVSDGCIRPSSHQWRIQKFSTGGASVSTEARLSLIDKNIGTSARFYA